MPFYEVLSLLINNECGSIKARRKSWIYTYADSDYYIEKEFIEEFGYRIMIKCHGSHIQAAYMANADDMIANDWEIINDN